MFYHNHLLALHAHDFPIQFYKKYQDFDLKNLGLSYWDRFNFMICWAWTPEILELSYWAWNNFMIYWT